MIRLYIGLSGCSTRFQVLTWPELVLEEFTDELSLFGEFLLQQLFVLSEAADRFPKQIRFIPFSLEETLQLLYLVQNR